MEGNKKGYGNVSSVKGGSQVTGSGKKKAAGAGNGKGCNMQGGYNGQHGSPHLK